jgi:mono/diheme cytochrome c family protein
MMLRDENYDRYLIVGLILTILILAGFSVYILTENNRLDAAAATFSKERIQHGREVYTGQCATCHGGQGEGGSGTALNNKSLLKNTFDEVFFSVIRSGVPSTQMPAWSVDFGGPLTDEDIRSVVAFIRAWEPTAPEIEPVFFEPNPARGALLFETTCATCHGSRGVGGEDAPTVNDPTRLSELDDEWYRGVIRHGRPAKGMPTWGTVLSPEQIEDLVALFGDWREGQDVVAAFSITELLGSAIYSLEESDLESAAIQINRAILIADGVGAELLNNAAAQLAAGDSAGAEVTLDILNQQWPLGDPGLGGDTYATSCSPCHGANGEGGGDGLFPQLNPNNFIQENANSDMVDFLLEGRPGTAMAGYDGRLTESELANVIAFLRTWQP